MKALLVGSCGLLFLGCGPPAPLPSGCAVGEAEQALEAPPVTMEELPLVLQALLEEAAKGELVSEQDPVEERFFHVVTVTQTPPPTPLPPCPSCR